MGGVVLSTLACLTDDIGAAATGTDQNEGILLDTLPCPADDIGAAGTRPPRWGSRENHTFPDWGPSPGPQEERSEGLAMVAEPTVRYGGAGAGDQDASERIRTFLEAHAGWYSKSELLEATGVPTKAWTKAIRRLLDQGLVERKGERRGARYRLVGGDS